MYVSHDLSVRNLAGNSVAYQRGKHDRDDRDGRLTKDQETALIHDVR